MDALTFDELSVGDTWTTPRRTVTETDVVMFASMTGDFNPLHCDHEFAASTPFRRPIAHGLLGLSWIAGLGSGNPRVATIAFAGIKNWQFLKPIHIGDTVYAELSIATKGQVGRRAGQVIWNNRLMNTEGIPLQQGQFVTLVQIAQGSQSKAAV